MKISISELAVPARGLDSAPDRELEPWIASYCGIKTSDIVSYHLERRSLDARKKPDVKILYRLVVELKKSVRPEKLRHLSRGPASPEKTVWHEPELSPGKVLQNPLIVGAGPAGLFAALTLALAGCRPIVVDRGFDVVRRKKDIDHFFSTRVLQEDSNLLYGEGGAGTWSDGKLYTRIRDPRMDFVMRTFVECGADPEILYFSHPHIGSDRLPHVIATLREKIIALGGSFLWGTHVRQPWIRNGICCGVELEDGSRMEAPLTLIACGHSARPLIQRMLDQQVEGQLKGFQIGCRMEHPQSFIDWMQYGMKKRPGSLGAAEYNLSSKPSADGRFGGATSFCMCPGGEILPAVCETNTLCTNGMSNAARDGFFANAALVTTVPPEKFSRPEEAFRFLHMLESKSFEAGGGLYVAPAQSAAAFVKGTAGKLPDRGGSYRLGMKPDRLDQLLPDFALGALKRALIHFDAVAPGFLKEGILVGLETRVSSPVRFLRNAETLSSSVPGLYIAGEGAGMAGGITSAAVDGVKLAESMIRFC